MATLDITLYVENQEHLGDDAPELLAEVVGRFGAMAGMPLILAQCDVRLFPDEWCDESAERYVEGHWYCPKHAMFNSDGSYYDREVGYWH